MNRDECVFLVQNFFCKLEELVTTPTKYLDVVVTFKYREIPDKSVNVLSFCLDGEGHTRVLVFPHEHEGLGLFNSRAVLYHTDKFFRVKKTDEIGAGVTTIIPEEFDISDFDISFNIHSIELNEFSKFAVAIEKIKRRFNTNKNPT